MQPCKRSGVARRWRRIWDHASQERAQGITEFAIVSMALMFFFLGTVDFARFMYYDTAIRNAARTGAETASNYCYIPGCGLQSSPTSDDVVMQSTYCEATGAQAVGGSSLVSLQPQINCTPCTTSTCDPCSSTSPYLGACTTCRTDICVSRSPSGSPAAGQTVTVYVGYNFRPISFLMAPFFNTVSCWKNTVSGSTESTHTLCAQAVGRVSSS